MMMIDESLIPSTSTSISTNSTNNISISNSSNAEQQSTTLNTAKQMQNSDENERKREECLMRVLQKESRFEKLKPKCHKAKQDLVSLNKNLKNFWKNPNIKMITKKIKTINFKINYYSHLFG